MPDIEMLAALVAAMACGAMLFFSSVIAPLVFVRLPKKAAGDFMRRLFPDYYLIMAGVTVAAALLAWKNNAAIALWIVLALFIAMRFWLVPGLERTRDKDQKSFSRLHRLSVAVNLVQMLLLAFAAVRLAA